MLQPALVPLGQPRPHAYQFLLEHLEGLFALLSVADGALAACAHLDFWMFDVVFVS